jgi:hypothetical protein
VRITGWLLLGLCAGVSAFGAEPVWVPSGETTCEIEGWSIDADSKGTNVRAAPSVKARVIGKLPRYVNNENYRFGIEFEIIGSHNGWLKITGAKDDSDRSGKPTRPTYAGTGWISGNLVRFGVQSGLGYARPDAASARLLDLGYEYKDRLGQTKFDRDWLISDRGEIERVVACQGKWALLDYRLLRERSTYDALIPLSAAQRKRGRAWFGGICGDQETTCDGAGADFSDTAKTLEDKAVSTRQQP